MPKKNPTTSSTTSSKKKNLIDKEKEQEQEKEQVITVEEEEEMDEDEEQIVDVDMDMDIEADVDDDEEKSKENVEIKNKKSNRRSTIKKRGRRPKEKIYSTIEPIANNSADDHIILHLPITMEDLKKEDSNIIINIEYQPKIDIPVPYQPINNFQDNFSEFSQPNQVVDKCNTIIYVKDKEIIQVDDSEEKKLVKRNIQNIMFEFADANEKHLWVESTNIHCFWCSHPFTSPACALPIKYVAKVFYLIGCFCSFNCAAAYNFEYPSYNMWERYSLLNLLYKLLYNTPYMKIKLAPPKNTLKIFGGFMSIDEFRNNFLTMKTYQVVYPPLISIIPRIEENIFNNPITNTILDDETITSASNLKLKRSKPITNPKTTLESYMSVKVI